MAIHKVADNVYVISASQCSRPGAFATERAARIGQRRLDEELRELQNKVNAAETDYEKRVITEKMLRDAPRWPKAPVKSCWECGEDLWGGGRYFDVVLVEGKQRYLHKPCAAGKIR